MRTRKKTIIQISIIAAIFLIIVLFYIFSQKKSLPETQVIVSPVRITKPQYGSVEKTVLLTGFVESNSIVTIVPKAQGVITELSVKTGQWIEKNSVIARIDPEPYELQLAQADAAYNAMEQTWKRIESLFASGSLTRQVYDQTYAQYQAVKSQKEQAQLQLSYTVITTPISGIVLQVHTYAGNTASYTTPLLTVGDAENIKIKLSVPEQYYGYFVSPQLKDGTAQRIQKVSIEIPALNTESQKNGFFEGSVQTVTPFISSQSRTFEITCTVDSQTFFNMSTVTDMHIPPGMFARVQLVLEKAENVYYLPYKTQGGANTLWYVEDGIAKKMPLETLFEGDTFFTIANQFSDYDFIIEGQHFLKENAPVRIMED